MSEHHEHTRPADDIEQRLQVAEHALEQLRRRQADDRRRRMRDVADGLAESEHRARRDAEQSRRQAARQPRQLPVAHRGTDLPTVDLDRVDLASLRIEQL